MITGALAHTTRTRTLAALALVAGLIVAGCSSTEPSAQVVGAAATTAPSPTAPGPVDLGPGTTGSTVAPGDAERLPAIPGARGRPRLEGNTLVTDSGELMRGANFWFLPVATSQWIWARSEEALDALVADNLNAVRVAVAWDPDSSVSLEEYLSELDTLVARAGVFHPDYGRRFWEVVAPRYAAMTHVVYELHNEPVFGVANYEDVHFEWFNDTFELVRSLAPETHVMLFSFALVQNLEGDTPPTITEVVDRFTATTGFDWANANASVAFHGYWVTSSRRMVELFEKYPVVNTEIMPSIAGVPEATVVDGEPFQQAVMERLRISWFDWSAWSRETTDQRQAIMAAARAGGWAWPKG